MRSRGFRLTSLLALAVCVAAGAACGSKKKAAPAGPARPAQAAREPVSVTHAVTDRGELLRALQTPHDELFAALGAHRLELKSTMKVTGAAAETLEEDHTLAIDGKGRFTMLHTNSRDYGKDVVFLGDDLYIRQRYGKYLHRPAEKGEGQRLRDETFGTLAAYLEVVGFALEPGRAEDAEVAGRAAKKLTLAKAASPGTPAQESELHPERKWRETVVPVAIEGTVALDQKTAAPLSANVHVRYQFQREGQPVEVDLTLTMDVKDVGTEPAIAAPPADAFVEIPVRDRPVLERDELLGKEGTR